MNSQLLCTQALLESVSFKLLSYDRVDQTKKSIQKLNHQLTLLESKLNLELKIFETSLIIGHHPSDPLQPDLARFPTNFRRLYDQKHSLQSQLDHLKTSLLHHLAAVLALGLKRSEHELQRARLDHHHHHHHPHPPNSFDLTLHHPISPSPPPTSTSTRSTRFNSTQRFDGPHLFPNHHNPPTHHSLSHDHLDKTNVFSPPTKNSDPIPRANDILNEELSSLKALLAARDAIISEQSSDLHLLELELETLKQSLSDQSTHHQQSLDLQTDSQADRQRQIEGLEIKNLQLTQSLESSLAQLESNQNQVHQLDSELQRLRSDLELERSSGSSNQELITTRAREAQDRVRALEDSHTQLERKINVLDRELKLARETGDRSLGEIAQLKNQLERYEGRRVELESEIRSLQTQIDLNAQRFAQLEASNEAVWQSFINRLSGLRDSLNHSASPPSLRLSDFLSNLSTSPPINREAFSDELIECWMDYIQTTQDRLQKDARESLTSLTQVRAQAEESAKSQQQKISDLTRKLDDLQAQNRELERSIDDRRHLSEPSPPPQQEHQEVDGGASELERLKDEISLVRQELLMQKRSNDPQPIVGHDQNLRELWKTLPANLESFKTINLEGGDLTTLKAIFGSEPPPAKKTATATVAVGLGGLFGLGKRTPTPTPITPPPSQLTLDGSDYSIDRLVDQVRLLVEMDKKLIDRIIRLEIEKDDHKAQVIKTQKLLDEALDTLKTNQSQAKELEQRLEYADTQSAAMLEKVNDLMENEERANMMVRRMENTIQKNQQEIEALKQQSTTKSIGGQEERMREQIEDLEEEIKELKSNELKLRDQFLKDLSELNEQNSTLKTKNRQLERSISKNQ